MISGGGITIAAYLCYFFWIENYHLLFRIIENCRVKHIDIDLIKRPGDCVSKAVSPATLNLKPHGEFN